MSLRLVSPHEAQVAELKDQLGLKAWSVDVELGDKEGLVLDEEACEAALVLPPTADRSVVRRLLLHLVIAPCLEALERQALILAQEDREMKSLVLSLAEITSEQLVDRIDDLLRRRISWEP